MGGEMGKKMLRLGENWGGILEKTRSNRSPVSGHGVGRYAGRLLSTQPSMGLSSPTKNLLSPAFEKQNMHKC